MTDARVTFIIPIYGVAAYLPACLDSLATQTDGDFQAILVDDGSTDGCAQICDAYAAKDARFRVIHQPNKGRSGARNAGLDACRSEWIWFVDGDDTLRGDALARVRSSLDKPCDMILLGTRPNADTPSHAMNRAEVAAYRRSVLCNTLPDIDPEFAWMKKEHLRGSCCNKLFRRDFIEAHHMRFAPNIVTAQDLLFATQALELVESAEFLQGEYYQYNLNPGSITIKYNPQAPKNHLLLLRALQDCLREHEDPEATRLFYMQVFHMIKKCIRLYFGHAQNAASARQVNREFRTFAEQPPIAEALRRCDKRLLDGKLRLFVMLCRIGSVRLIKRVFPNLCTAPTSIE